MSHNKSTGYSDLDNKFKIKLLKKISSKRYNVYLFDFYENRYDSIQLKVAKKKDKYIIDDIIF